jgi:hypothetical protein
MAMILLKSSFLQELAMVQHEAGVEVCDCYGFSTILSLDRQDDGNPLRLRPYTFLPDYNR